MVIDARLQLDGRLSFVPRALAADAESAGDGVEQPAAGARRRRIDLVADHRAQ
jgi:hypothetical protein